MTAPPRRPPQRKVPAPAGTGTTRTTPNANESAVTDRNAPRGRNQGRELTDTSSRTVTYSPVLEFIAALIAQANNTVPPGAGTPAWCALADGDPLKVLSLVVAGGAHVLDIEAAQQARAEASKAIAAAADWPAIAREVQQLHAARRAGTRIERTAS
jgi:hypothetical protein